MVGWCHRLNGHEFEQAAWVGDGQGGLACCSPWGCKQSDMTERLNWTGFDPWVRKIPWRRKWQPTPMFLPGKSHGQRSLVGYTLWGHKELNTTEWLIIHTLMYELDFFLPGCIYIYKSKPLYPVDIWLVQPIIHIWWVAKVRKTHFSPPAPHHPASLPLFTWFCSWRPQHCSQWHSQRASDFVQYLV